RAGLRGERQADPRVAKVLLVAVAEGPVAEVLALPHDALELRRRVHLQQGQVEVDAHGRRGRAAALLSPGPLRTADGSERRPGGARSSQRVPIGAGVD